MSNSVDISATASKVSHSPVVERALDVLLTFAGGVDELGVTEIARQLSLDKAQVYRYLSALREKGFITRNGKTRRYALGMSILQLSQSLNRQYDVAARSTIHLEHLRDVTGETASIATRVGRYRVHLAQVESRHDLRRTFALGTSLPVHCGATGLCLLAFADSPGGVNELLAKPLERFTPLTICDSHLLDQVLGQIRADGWALTLGQRTEGIRSIAAPAWGWRGDLFALVASGPEERFTEQRARETLAELKRIATVLTRDLGGTSRAPEDTSARRFA